MQDKGGSSKEGFDQLRNEAYEVLNANCLLPDDFLVCECFSVSVGDIRERFKVAEKITLVALTTEFCMGTGCKTCFKNKEDWVNKIY
jgi:NAD(P)H-nitrite reductase large subunit